MCVVIIAEDKKPTRALLDAAGRANGHGIGVGWTEKRGMVCWRKGITQKELYTLVDEVRLPFVVHFRIASVGGISHELTHPFPIVAEANALHGRLKGGALLFHNGHWSPWKETLLCSLTSDGVSSLPPGVWSDSRAMALLAHRHGESILSLIEGQRIAVLTKEGAHCYGGGWVQAAGLWLSNTSGLVASLPELARASAIVTAAARSVAPVSDFRFGPGGGQRLLTGFGGGSRGRSVFLDRDTEILDRALASGRELEEVEHEYDAAAAAADGDGLCAVFDEDDGEAQAVDTVMARRRGEPPRLIRSIPNFGSPGRNC